MSLKFSVKHLLPISKKDCTYRPLTNGVLLNGKHAGTVILIHGLTGTTHEMGYLARFLNRKGYNVITVRLANHGKPMAVLMKTKWQEFYESVEQALRNALSVSNGGPVFVAGLCMGAILALLLAEDYPEQISAAGCLSTTMFYDGWGMPWCRRFLPVAYRTPLKHFLFFKEDPPYGVKDPVIQKSIQKSYSTARLDDTEGVDETGYAYLPVTLLHQHHLLVKHVAKRLASIELPVQLIQALDDDTTSIKNSQFVYDRIRSKMKEIVLLENSYHVITVDQERDKVAEKLYEFFSRVQAGRIVPAETAKSKLV